VTGVLLHSCGVFVLGLTSALPSAAASACAATSFLAAISTTEPATTARGRKLVKGHHGDGSNTAAV